MEIFNNVNKSKLEYQINLMFIKLIDAKSHKLDLKLTLVLG